MIWVEKLKVSFKSDILQVRTTVELNMMDRFVILSSSFLIAVAVTTGLINSDRHGNITVFIIFIMLRLNVG